MIKTAPEPLRKCNSLWRNDVKFLTLTVKNRIDYNYAKITCKGSAWTGQDDTYFPVFEKVGFLLGVFRGGCVYSL